MPAMAMLLVLAVGYSKEEENITTLEEPGSIEAGNVLVYDQQGTLKNSYSCTADNTRSDTIINKALTEVVQFSGGTISK